MKTPSPQRHHLVNCPSHDSSLDSCSTNSSSSSSSVLINVAGIQKYSIILYELFFKRVSITKVEEAVVGM